MAAAAAAKSLERNMSKEKRRIEREKRENGEEARASRNKWFEELTVNRSTSISSKQKV